MNNSMDAQILQLNPELESYRGLITALSEELQGLAQMWGTDSQFAKRATIKTAFSIMEGAVNLTKQYLLDNRSHLFSPEEIVALKESTVKINEKGNIDEKDYFPRIQENLLFTLNMLQKTAKEKHEVDRKSNEWKKFLDLVSLRHDLTHPKVTSTHQVSTDHLNDLGWTIMWLLDNVVEVSCVAWGRETPEAKTLVAAWSIVVDMLMLYRYVPVLALLKDASKITALENDLKSFETDIEVQCNYLAASFGFDATQTVQLCKAQVATLRSQHPPAQTV